MPLSPKTTLISVVPFHHQERLMNIKRVLLRFSRFTIFESFSDNSSLHHSCFYLINSYNVFLTTSRYEIHYNFKFLNTGFHDSRESS